MSWLRGRRRKERLGRLAAEHSTELYRYAGALTRERFVAEDLVQETFLRASRSLHALGEPARARRWLLTTLRRECFRQFERYQADFAQENVDDLCAAGGEPGSELLALRRAILALPSSHREVLALQALFGYSGSEIGELLGVPRATVTTRLFRARQQLRNILRDDVGRDRARLGARSPGRR